MSSKETVQSKILETKEKLWQRKIALSKQTGGIVVSVQFNCPGWPKISTQIEQAFYALISDFCLYLREKKIDYILSFFSEKSLGPIALLTLARGNEAVAVKQLTILFEENHPIGRLIDIDVLDTKQEFVERPMKRQCFLCEEPAIHCIQATRHTANELRVFFDNAISNYLANKCSFKEELLK